MQTANVIFAKLTSYTYNFESKDIHEKELFKNIDNQFIFWSHKISLYNLQINSHNDFDNIILYIDLKVPLRLKPVK